MRLSWVPLVNRSLNHITVRRTRLALKSRPLNHVREMPGSGFDQDKGFFRSFPQSLQAHSGVVVLSGHDRFLPNPFDFIIHLPAFHSMVCI
jgi:hypothetical protein